jgi:hypothetical protein
MIYDFGDRVFMNGKEKLKVLKLLYPIYQKQEADKNNVFEKK